MKLHGLVLALLLLAGPALAGSDFHVLLDDTDSDDAFLLAPRQVEIGPDGNVWVLDAGDSYFKVFTPKGRFLRRMGGQGEGPGRLQRTDGATFGFTPEGEMFFAEFYGGHNWLTVMTLEGDLVRTVTPDLQVFHGVSGAVALPGGRYLLEIQLDSRTEPLRDNWLYFTPHILVPMNTGGALGPEIVRTEYASMISTSPGGGTSNLPFTPVFAWAVDQDGRILWSDGLSTEIQVFDADGKPIDPLQTDLPAPRPVTSEELQAWQRARAEFMLERNASWWERFGRSIEDYDEAATPHPVLDALSITPAGRLLCAVRDDETAVYHLLDSGGHEVHTESIPVWGLTLGDGMVAWLGYDADGQARVNIASRPDDEVETLRRVAELAGD